MGANIAKEVADEKFCETTIGNYCKELEWLCFSKKKTSGGSRGM